MIRRIALMVGLFGVVSLTGCFSLNYDEDVRQIDHYGRQFDSMRRDANKLLFAYDQDNPFQD
jgi:hypothetical protein